MDSNILGKMFGKPLKNKTGVNSVKIEKIEKLVKSMDEILMKFIEFQKGNINI